MANRAQISWVEFEAPAATSSTYSKSGGIQSAWRGSDFSWDSFQREVAPGGWGNADLGGAYTLVGTAGDFSVSDGVGKITSPGHDFDFAKLLGVSLKNYERSGKVKISSVPTGSVLAVGPMLRGVDDNNYYRASIRFLATGDIETEISKIIAGVQTVIVANTTRLTGVAADTWVRWHVKIQANVLYFNVWLDGTAEPAWQATGTDSGNSFPNAGFVGFRANFQSLTNNPTVSVDDHQSFTGGMGDGINVTYFAKSGGTQSAGSLGGIKNKNVVRSGGISSVGSMSASRAITHSKSAGARGPVSVGGSKFASFAKASGISTLGIFGGVVSTPARIRISWVEFEIPGVASPNQAKTGGISSTGSLGGATFAANLFIRSGGFSGRVSLGISKNSNVWDDWSSVRTFTVVATPAKIGGIDSPGALGATRNTLASKTVGYAVGGQLGATKSVVFSKTGGIASAGSLGGTKNSNFSFPKSGGINSAASTGASRSHSHAKTGGTSSQGEIGLDGAYTAAKTGGFISVGHLAGDALTSSAFAKSGGFFSNWESSGLKIISIPKSGGISGSVSTGSGEIRKSGGIRSQSLMGANRTINHVKIAGTVTSTSVGGQKFVSFFKSAGTISSISFGGVQSQPYEKTGGFITVGRLGGSQNIPERRYVLDGGFSSTATFGASKLKLFRESGGIVSAGRVGDQPRIGIISAGKIGAVVNIRVRIKPNPRHQIMSVDIDETKLVEIGIS